MPDRDRPPASTTARPITPVTPVSRPAARCEPKTLCDRCGAEAYRMHAVWRCPVCGFKSDCCGW